MSALIFSPQHELTVIHAAQKFVEYEDYVDVVIACKDKTLKAHSLLLATISPFLKSVLNGHTCNCKQEIVIVLPDIRYDTMFLMLNFMYSGFLKINANELNEFYDLIELLQIDIDKLTSGRHPFKEKINKYKVSVAQITSEHQTSQSNVLRKRKALLTNHSTKRSRFPIAATVSKVGHGSTIEKGEHFVLFREASRDDPLDVPDNDYIPSKLPLTGVPVKKRGRPRKTPITNDVQVMTSINDIIKHNQTSKDDLTTRTTEKEEESGISGKPVRKRGRPKKTPITDEPVMSSIEDSVKQIQASKVKPQNVSVVNNSISVPDTTRRTEKEEESSISGMPVKKRARPRKAPGISDVHRHPDEQVIPSQTSRDVHQNVLSTTTKAKKEKEFGISGSENLGLGRVGSSELYFGADTLSLSEESGNKVHESENITPLKSKHGRIIKKKELPEHILSFGLSKEDKMAAEQFFHKHIEELVYPRQEECLDCIESRTDLFEGIVWQDVKHFIASKIYALRHRRKKSLDPEGVAASGNVDSGTFRTHHKENNYSEPLAIDKVSSEVDQNTAKKYASEQSNTRHAKSTVVIKLDRAETLFKSIGTPRAYRDSLGGKSKINISKKDILSTSDGSEIISPRKRSTSSAAERRGWDAPGSESLDQVDIIPSEFTLKAEIRALDVRSRNKVGAKEHENENIPPMISKHGRIIKRKSLVPTPSVKSSYLTNEAKIEAEQYFQENIEKEICPRKNDCLKCIESRKDLFQGKTWQEVRDYVKGKVAALQYRRRKMLVVEGNNDRSRSSTEVKRPALKLPTMPQSTNYSLVSDGMDSVDRHTEEKVGNDGEVGHSTVQINSVVKRHRGRPRKCPVGSKKNSLVAAQVLKCSQGMDDMVCSNDMELRDVEKKANCDDCKLCDSTVEVDAGVKKARGRPRKMQSLNSEGAAQKQHTPPQEHVHRLVAVSPDPVKPCVVCTQRGLQHMTKFACLKCDSALCARPCFPYFHAEKDVPAV